MRHVSVLGNFVDPARYRRGFGVFGLVIWFLNLFRYSLDSAIVYLIQKVDKNFKSTRKKKVEEGVHPQLFSRLSSKLVREMPVLEKRQYLYVDSRPDDADPRSSRSLEDLIAQQSGERSLRYFEGRGKKRVQEVDDLPEGTVKDA